MPTWGRDEEGRRKIMTEDQCIRRDTSLEALAALEAGVHARGRHRDGRQLQPAQRRRRGAAGHVGGTGEASWG